MSPAAAGCPVNRALAPHDDHFAAKKLIQRLARRNLGHADEMTVRRKRAASHHARLRQLQRDLQRPNEVLSLPFRVPVESVGDDREPKVASLLLFVFASERFARGGVCKDQAIHGATQGHFSA